MPALWPNILLLVPAAVNACDDFRMRRVSVLWLAVLAAGCLFVAVREQGPHTALMRGVMNAALAVLLLLVLAGWNALRHPDRRNLFAHALGAGDAWTMLALAPLFDVPSYVRFLLLSCLSALAWWIVRRPATLPLAGVMMLSLIVYIIFKPFGLWS